MRHDLSGSDLRRVLSKRFSNGKVPILLEGAAEVWDFLAILEYLGERFPDTQLLWPEAPEARAVARSVSAEMHSSFGALRNEAPVVMRFRSVSVELDAGATGYCCTVESDPSVDEWICQGLAETRCVDADERDWPSEPVMDL